MDVKAIILLVIFINLLFGARASASEDDQAWEDFKTKFNKAYKSGHEEAYRKKVFLENKRSVEDHNARQTIGGINETTFSLTSNRLSDMTIEEVNNQLNGFRFPSQLEAANRTSAAMLETLLEALDSSSQVVIPESLDWRAQGKVSEVKNQGACGSCWAFATTGALESMLARSGINILLSEQNLVDCATGRYGNYGCDGGFVESALEYVSDNGIMSAADYQYTAKNGPCKFDQSKSVTQVAGSVTLAGGDEELLRKAVALAGPIPVAIDAGNMSFQLYESGVYNDRACRNLLGNLNHAVLVVGYGNDQVGGDYWIVKNSWGSDWGSSGYIKMARNRGNLCGIATRPVVPIA